MITNSIFIGQDHNEDIQDHQAQECKSESKQSTESGEIRVGQYKSDDEIKYDKDLINLNADLKYSKAVQSFIKKHKRWRQGIMKNRDQSKDLYRSDNIRKKTWRALRQIVTFKAKQLIKSIPNRMRKDSKCIFDKLHNFVSSFKMCEDPKTYYTLMSCMIFLGKKKSYNSMIKRVAPDAHWQEFMINESKHLRDCNENKKKDLEWKEIFSHPILRLAKTLLYREEEMQDVFFIKALGCMPKTNKEETRTRMTIVDDYEIFRQKLLQTVKERFGELC